MKKTNLLGVIALAAGLLACSSKESLAADRTVDRESPPAQGSDQVSAEEPAAAPAAPEVVAPEAVSPEEGPSAGELEISNWVDGGAIPSGMVGVDDIRIIKVHKNGSGPVCGTGRRASLKYKAMQADGRVLDPGTRPFTFLVGQGSVIQGWHVIVSKMRVGDSFTVLLPMELAYGASKGDLKFDMELLSFQ